MCEGVSCRSSVKAALANINEGFKLSLLDRDLPSIPVEYLIFSH